MRPRASIVIILPLLLCTTDGQFGGEIYRWIDRNGQVHFTDDYTVVPPEYRDRVQSHPSSPPSATPPEPTPPAKSKKAERANPASPRFSTTGRQAKVVAVLDGDTIVISGGEKVRYAGLNTPESHHPDKLPEYCGQEAFEANRRLVAGKTVRLEFDARRRDKYGRLLAYVYVDGLFVNAELVRQGYAQVSTYKDNQRHHEEFERLQQSAIVGRRGLWGGCTAVGGSRVPAQPKPRAARKSH